MFGKRLKLLRKGTKMTQQDLAILLNVSPSTIGMYEQGRRDPDTNTLKFLAEYFNVTIDYLLGRSSSKAVQLCNNEADQLADNIIEIYIRKGKIKPEEKLTLEKRQKILKELEAFIDMTNILEDN